MSKPQMIKKTNPIQDSDETSHPFAYKLIEKCKNIEREEEKFARHWSINFMDNLEPLTDIFPQGIKIFIRHLTKALTGILEYRFGKRGHECKISKDYFRNPIYGQRTCY